VTTSLADPACLTLPLARYPGMNRFVLDWLAGDARATRFLPRTAPSSVTHATTPALIDALIESNKRWGSNVAAEVRRWATGKTATIVTGQQVGLAGGPLYTAAKLASAVKWKRQLEAKGQQATIFFWLASEDHDLAEASTVHLPVSAIDASRDVNRQLDLVTIRPRAIDSRAAVGPMPVPEDAVRQIVDLLNVPRPSWLREGITFTDSFAELLATAFAGEPIVFVDSLLPELRRAASPFFETLMEKWSEAESAIGARSAELQTAGYAAQVIPRDGDAYTLLFRLDERFNRHMIRKPEAVNDAATLSTSALTRPLLQDFVLRPDVFIGGPAEVAYYAQIAPLHALLDIPMPHVALRGHVLVASRRLMKAAGRYGIDVGDVFGTPDALLVDREAPGVAEIKTIAERAQRNLAEEIARIGEIALPAEHSLARAINRSIGHIEFHFAKLTERAIRGLVRKDRERYGVAKELVSTLYPDRHAQDRVVNWFALWTKHGEAMLPAILDAVQPDQPSFRIVGV
jgi:bacillithiol biosynthesis cysteine-adding enzyme BshC